jgi:hypothetical protein
MNVLIPDPSILALMRHKISGAVCLHHQVSLEGHAQQWRSSLREIP